MGNEQSTPTESELTEFFFDSTSNVDNNNNMSVSELAMQQPYSDEEQTHNVKSSPTESPKVVQRDLPIQNIKTLNKISYYPNKMLSKGGGGNRIFEGRFDGKTCAVKEIPILNATDLERAKKEVDIMRGLDHPNIIRYFDSEYSRVNTIVWWIKQRWIVFLRSYFFKSFTEKY